MRTSTYFRIIILSAVLLSCNDKKDDGKFQNATEEKEASNIPSNKERTKISPQFSMLNNQISQVVRKVFQDSEGVLWFATQSGAFRLNGDSLTHINGIQSEAGKSVTVKDISEGKDRKIWLGHTGGISSVEDERVENFYESDGLISNDVWSIASDIKGNVWIGTIEGACKYNGQEFTKFQLPEGQIDSTRGVSSTKMVHNIMEDSHGTIWFSTNAGLFSYKDNKLNNFSDKFGIETNFINEIFEDKRGEYWISTKNSLYHLKGMKIENITGDKIEVGKGIGSISEDGEGNIWLVSNQHFLYTYDRKKLVEYEKSEQNKGPVIYQIYKDQEDRMWFVGFGGAYRLENGKFVNITKYGPW